MTLRSSYSVVVIGAGQAGLSMSAVLKRQSVDHVVLEANRIGERWRSARWDSFCLVTPNWATRLSGDAYVGDEPDAFLDRDDLVGYFESYAAERDLPIVEGVSVSSVRAGTSSRFAVATSNGAIECNTVVVATGTHQYAKIPSLGEIDASDNHAWSEMHASQYRNPAQLAAGGVLVVGAGQSGCQIAEELNEAGRAVWLSTSQVGRLPRTYLGVDSIAWQYRMGFLDRNASALESPQHRFRPDPHLSGKNGGHTINLHKLGTDGVKLLGRLASRTSTGFKVASDLNENVKFADDFAAQFRRNVDAFLEAKGETTPGTQGDRVSVATAQRSTSPQALAETSGLDLVDSNITSVIWATGFGFDFSWVEFPVFDESGYPEQREWRTAIPGLHFLGLNYVDTRGSGILYGVGVDAENLGEAIATV